MTASALPRPSVRDEASGTVYLLYTRDELSDIITAGVQVLVANTPSN